MKTVRLYQFYNFVLGKHGEPFRMCDECIKSQPIPEPCQLRKMADRAIGQCQADWHAGSILKEERTGDEL